MPNVSDPVKLHRAKELRREMTREERMLWLRLRANQLGGLDFYRQKVLAGFIVDLCCPEARLIVEEDGGIHEQQIDYDAERDAILRGHGWHVIRVSNDAVRSHIPAVLARILTACRDSRQPMPDHLHASNDATVLPFPSRREGVGG